MSATDTNSLSHKEILVWKGKLVEDLERDEMLIALRHTAAKYLELLNKYVLNESCEHVVRKAKK